MTEKELKELRRGDIVQHRTSGESYIIIDEVNPGHFIGIRHISITHAPEWILFSKSEKCAK